MGARHERAGWGALSLLVAACGNPSGVAADAGSSGQTSSTAADGPTTTSGADSTGMPPATSTSTTSADTGTEDTTSTGTETVALNLVFVHGIKSCPEQQQSARDSLVDLDEALQAVAPELVAAFEAEHPGVHVQVASTRVNVYLAEPSPDMPAGADPTQMDQWSVGYDGCGSEVPGDPCTTAYEWRWRLRAEIEAQLPGADNLVIIGHSTGARTAVELAADVGPGGVGTGGWGMSDRILGTVAIHGMVDSLANYDLLGPFGFQSVCETGGGLLDLFGGCDPGDGWCEYATELSGVEATQWVVEHTAALTLTSVQDCGVAFFDGESDGSLPVRAQSAPFAAGLTLTPVPGTTWGPAHGERYGGFCHSAIDTPSTEGHDVAVQLARDHIASWLFVSAPRVVAEGMEELESELAPGETSPPIAIGPGTCPPGATGTQAEVVGVRLHPGVFDGDDTPIDPAEIEVQVTGDCAASFTWTLPPAEPDPHRARFFWKITTDADRGVLARDFGR